MASLKINLFGEFRVQREEELIEREEWGRQKARSLLKLLLTHPGRVFSRDEITDALWPDVPPAGAEHSLWTTVGLLRRALEPDLERGTDSHYIVRRRPGYLFNPQADCEVDAWQFEDYRQRAEAARETGQLDEAIGEYRDALELVRDDFLAEEPYEDWTMEAREEWRERRLAVLSELAECLALRGRYTEAIGTCNRALALDEYREDLHRRLMLYHYCAGEQALALRVYRDYAKMLKKELGTAPSSELARLRAQIEDRDVPGVDTLRRYPRPRRPLRFPYSFSRTHFVGRDREYALLAERLREVTEGRGGAVAVEGEAGVGKTRLVEEFLGYAKSRGARVFSGRCYERELGPPLEPILDTIGRVTDVEEMVSRISRSRAEKLDNLGQTEPYDSARVYRALAGELIRESHDDNNEGLVLFVDDVQWADPATLDFLSYLARRVLGERVLLAFTYRREDAPGLSGWLDRLAEKRAVSTLSLGRLSQEDLTRILSRMASRSFGELPSLARFLHRESEGNPFYAVEYLRWLIESGAIQIDSRRRISGLESEALREGELPSGVRSLIRARLRGLDGRAQDLLALAAVIGRNFDLELLCRAAARAEANTFDIVEPLISSGLIVESADKEAYYLSHDKLRQALYEDTGGPRRRELHLRVAEALGKAGGEPAELAHHYLRAKAWSPALEKLTLAARKAEESYAWDTALENYARALEVVGKLPDSEETRFELLAARERLLEHMDRKEERAAAVREMFEVANRLGDRALIAEVHIRRVGALTALSDPEGAVEAWREAVDIFRGLGDPAGEARVHREVGYVRWANREYAEALEANFKALRLHRELGDRQGEAGAAGNIAQVYRGMGNYERALRWAEEAARIYRELGDKLGEGVRISTMAAIHREQGDLEAALSLNLKTLRFNTELGAKNLNVAQHSTCGTLYLRLGDSQKALEHFRAAASLSWEIGYTRDEEHSLMSVGIALEQVGDPEGAAGAYRRAVELLDTAYEESGILQELSAKADALNLLAAVLRGSLDQPVEALDAYEAAAGIYQELGDAYRLRELLLDLAGLRWRIGNLEGSARSYEEALDLAREHGATAHEAAALASLSVVYRDLGRLKEPVRCGREAVGLLRNLNDLQAEAYVLTSLAESYRRRGHFPSALSCLRRSLRLRKKIGDEKGEVGALQDLARIYESLGETGRARVCSEEAVWKRQELGKTQVALGVERRN